MNLLLAVYNPTSLKKAIFVQIIGIKYYTIGVATMSAEVTRNAASSDNKSTAVTVVIATIYMNNCASNLYRTTNLIGLFG
jgi:hypothetical protein